MSSDLDNASDLTLGSGSADSELLPNDFDEPLTPRFEGTLTYRSAGGLHNAELASPDMLNSAVQSATRSETHCSLSATFMYMYKFNYMI